MSAPDTTAAWEWKAMGTTWRIYHQGCVGQAEAGLVARLVEEDEARWSRFRPHSEVSGINRHSGAPVAISGETRDILLAALAWERDTAGVFQPLVGDALVAWGYAGSIDAGALGVPESPAGRTMVPGGLRVDPAGRWAIIPQGTRLDLGGIGKGWSLNRAADALRQAGVDGTVLIDAGGDMTAVTGDHMVVVEVTGEHVMLREGWGIATSGYGRRQWRNGDGREAHHLIDPATGSPGPRRHATVMAHSVVTADVLAKVLVLRPRMMESFGEASVVVDEDGDRRQSEQWEEVLAA